MNEASSISCSKVMYMLSPPLRERREKKYAPSGRGKQPPPFGSSYALIISQSCKYCQELSKIK